MNVLLRTDLTIEIKQIL